MHVADTLTRTPRSFAEASRQSGASRARDVMIAANAAFGRADRFFSRELEARFGKRAGDVRYTPEGMGEEGSTLRFAHDQRERLRVVWEQAKEDYRAACDARYGRKEDEALTDDVCRCEGCAA